MKILKKSAHVARAFLYLVFYHIPYRTFSAFRNTSTALVTISVRDISYKLKLHVSEGGLAEDLYINRIREYPNVEYFYDYMKKYAEGTVTYLGIGSNIGYYLFISRLIFLRKNPNATLYAIEPVKNTFSRLLENIRINGASEVRPLQIGIGDTDSIARMSVMKQRNLSKIQNGDLVMSGEIERTENIQLQSLKTLFRIHRIPRRGIILRCDIEGYEYNLIVGNREFLKTLKNMHIIMEFHPFYLHEKKSIELLNTLKTSGFTLDQVISCEPLYFLKTPKRIRRILISLFLFQYDADTLGKIERFKSIDDLIDDLKNPDSALYVYPNLHFYFTKK